ncbi:PTS system fructose specific IIBC component, putative fragment [Alteracholeplasma palmae J233]|uniref:PTS system fructose specific IIBC component, putative n=1 Tax=Alteracholeplasma palmae (strain ATCC 49389 / J233) TaxID=1318466 RepID=U4KKE1_ALTPJ|nr:PTS fructose transporter subunit IIB [Alteracholeplasma palmae]CCV64184.1 PTS system fructose specific IIBC component, putative fragment [Alteracholeplasma palmae J233]
MKVIAITACPMGIAHTYIAAEALRKAAYAKGIDLIIEKHAALGIEGTLTEEEIKDADAIIIAADMHVDLTRFKDKKIVTGTTADAISNADALFEKIELE